jgi:hypothetical protein
MLDNLSRDSNYDGTRCATPVNCLVLIFSSPFFPSEQSTPAPPACAHAARSAPAACSSPRSVQAVDSSGGASLTTAEVSLMGLLVLRHGGRPGQGDTRPASEPLWLGVFSIL